MVQPAPSVLLPGNADRTCSKPGKSHLSGQGPVQLCEAAHVNWQETHRASQLHPDMGQVREGGMDITVETSRASRGAQKTLKALLEKGQLQHGQKKLQGAHMAHKT